MKVRNVRKSHELNPQCLVNIINHIQEKVTIWKFCLCALKCGLLAAMRPVG